MAAIEGFVDAARDLIAWFAADVMPDEAMAASVEEAIGEACSTVILWSMPGEE